MKEGFDRHQLAGLDNRERGFNRPVEVERGVDSYRAILRYEATRIETPHHQSQDVALMVLIQILQARGYRQLRTQMSYRNGVYLGSQEVWVEYPDAPHVERKPLGFVARILQWFRRARAMKNP